MWAGTCIGESKMDDLPAVILDETAALQAPTADRNLGRAVRTAQGWTVYHGADSGSEACGFGKPASFSDIADAIVAIEDRAGFGRRRMGSEIASAVLVGRQISRDGVQHNVYEMPICEVEDETRFRN
jgi:hypothetical protein